MAVMGHRGTNLPVGAGVFVGGLRVVGIVEPAVPTVESGDLVTDEAAVTPTWSPEDRLAFRRGHDNAAVVRHIGIASSRSASKRVKTTGPMDAQHRWLVLYTDR